MTDQDGGVVARAIVVTLGHPEEARAAVGGGTVVAAVIIRAGLGDRGRA